MTEITSTQFQREFGRYLSKARKEPVTITNHGRAELVMVDADEYSRLKSFDTRQAHHPEELSEEWQNELAKGFQGENTPELDHLLDQ